MKLCAAIFVLNYGVMVGAVSLQISISDFTQKCYNKKIKENFFLGYSGDGNQFQCEVKKIKKSCLRFFGLLVFLLAGV